MFLLIANKQQDFSKFGKPSGQSPDHKTCVCETQFPILRFVRETVITETISIIEIEYLTQS